jgi:hypothetical protein
MINLEDADEDNKEQLQSDVCELSFQHMTNVDSSNTAAEQKVEEDGGEDDSEEG